MVERPIKKSERQILAEQAQAEGQTEGQTEQFQTASVAESSEPREKKPRPTLSKDRVKTDDDGAERSSRGDRGDRNDRGDRGDRREKGGKGRKGFGKEEAKPATSMALMRGPKPKQTPLPAEPEPVVEILRTHS
ncbi:MAG: hypothetical protein MUF49_00280 [Oculatellaceae cyanobacterium Prado106]|nr:hypothetical protein [Oculatellaceae cyanobacterium Prado106]